MAFNFKSLSDEVLDDLLKGIPFKVPPHRHQKISLAWALSTGDRIAFFSDIGVGKTYITLSLLEILRPNRTLVVCPNSVIESWIDQIDKFSSLSYCVLKGRTEDRIATLNSHSASIFIINYEGLHHVFGMRVGAEGTKKKWFLDYKMLREAKVNFTVFDESHHLKSPKALQTKVAYELSRKASGCVLMTGTPISTSEDDLWAQMYVLNGGQSLGSSFFAFHQKYFDKNFFGKWFLKAGKLPEVLSRIAPVSIRFHRGECLDLPKKTYSELRCDLTSQQRKLISKIVDGIKIEKSNGSLSQQSASASANKMTQILSGFLLLDKGGILRLKKNPKLDLLSEVLEGLDEKVIVFHSFVEEGRMIEERLKKSKIRFASLRGEISDKARSIETFSYDPKIQVLVAHPRSGGEGLNFQMVSTAIFFSSSVAGAAIRNQAEGRIWRFGQENPCLFLDLLVRNSLDESRLDKMKSRKEVLSAILRFVEEWQ